MHLSVATLYFSTNNYLFKVNNRKTLEHDVKYVYNKVNNKDTLL